LDQLIEAVRAATGPLQMRYENPLEVVHEIIGSGFFHPCAAIAPGNRSLENSYRWMDQRADVKRASHGLAQNPSDQITDLLVIQFEPPVPMSEISGVVDILAEGGAGGADRVGLDIRLLFFRIASFQIRQPVYRWED
jgi:hypothetical protein